MALDGAVLAQLTPTSPPMLSPWHEATSPDVEECVVLSDKPSCYGKGMDVCLGGTRVNSSVVSSGQGSCVKIAFDGGFREMEILDKPPLSNISE